MSTACGRIIFQFSTVKRVRIDFQARALFPVRAEAVVSRAYSYYRPEWQGEALGGRIAVGSA